MNDASAKIRPLDLRRTARAIASNYGDKGGVVITVGEGGVRIGVENLTPQELRDALCVAINYSFVFEGGGGSLAMKFQPLTVLETYARNGDFYPDKDRILAAMLFLMNEHPGITQYQIVKSIFLADEEHLSRYGRPVTFDNYVAMPRGPVPSLVLNLLKPERAWEFTRIYQVDPPWVCHLRPSRSGRAFEYYPDRGADMDALSATDIAALRNGLKTVRESSEVELDKRLHDHPAYVEAWKRRCGKRSVPMKTEILLRREGSADVISDLSFISRP